MFCTDPNILPASRGWWQAEGCRANLKNLKTVFEQRYKDQSKPSKGGKKDAKASRSETGAAYLFAKLRF